MAEGGDCEDYTIAKATALGFNPVNLLLGRYADPLGVADHIVLLVRWHGMWLEFNSQGRIVPVGLGIVETTALTPP